jgi:hypothetical protein
MKAGMPRRRSSCATSTAQRLRRRLLASTSAQHRSGLWVGSRAILTDGILAIG